MVGAAALQGTLATLEAQNKTWTLCVCWQLCSAPEMVCSVHCNAWWLLQTARDHPLAVTA